MAEPLPGANIRASDIFGLTAFTPTWTGLTLGTGASNEGWYQTQGNLVFWGLRLQLGTGGTATTTVQFDLPVTAWTGGGNSLTTTLGSAHLRDQSALAFYSGVVTSWNAAGTQGCFSFAGNTSRWSNTAPVATAVDDVISASGVYRAQ